MTTILFFSIGALIGLLVGFTIGSVGGANAERKDWELLTNKTKNTVNKSQTWP